MPRKKSSSTPKKQTQQNKIKFSDGQGISSATDKDLETFVQNEMLRTNSLHNGLGGAIGFNWINGFPGGYGNNPWAPQVEQVNTVFENMRWYMVSNMRQPLSQAYVEIGLIQAVVDVPVDDALRGGVKINSKQLSEEQIMDLQISLDRDDDLNTVAQACKWNRLYGGAGILIIVEGQDPEDELDLTSINKNTSIEFRAVDMWELFWDKQNTEGYDPELQTHEFEHYNYYAEKIHKSRVMRLKGMVAPSFIRPRLRGWGFSVVETLLRSINQYLKSSGLIFACLDEFKVDVYKIKNLVNTLLSPQGEQQITQRVKMANWQKNYQNALVMDSEDDWDHKQLSFGGIAETMQQIRMQVAADMRMPITKLFGTSSSQGIGNTDQNDMENYNSMVESQVRNKLKYDILRMCEIKCQQLFGFIPNDLQLEFKPLRELTAEQEQNVKTSIFNRALAARQAGEIDQFTFREICNKESLLSVQLDNSDDLLNPDDPTVGEVVEEGEQNPANPADADDPGANREERRKPTAWTKSTIDNDLSTDPLNPGSTPAVETLPNPPAVGSPNPDTISYHAEFDMMAYLKEGGDDWIGQTQLQYYKYPEDGFLWQHAKAASLKYTGTNNHKFTIWYYRKMGGKFGDAASAQVKNKKLPDLSLEPIDQPVNKNEDQLHKKFDLQPHTYADDPHYYEEYKKLFGEILANEEEKFENPGKVDESLWEKAKKKAAEEGHSEKWPLISFIYEKMGGKFHKKK